MEKSFRGWNTWDAYYLNGLVLLPEALRLRFYLYDPQTDTTCEAFDWRTGMHKLGSNALWNGYGQIDLKWENGIIRLEFAQGENDHLVVRLSPIQAAAHLQVIVEVDRAWGMPLKIESQAANMIIQIEERVWRVQGNLQRLPLPVLFSGQNFLAYALDQPLWVQAWTSDTAYDSTAVEAILHTRAAAYDEIRLQTSGWLENAADGLVRSVHWNTIWEPTRGRICSPVSRDWCRNPAWGGYVLFDWDTFFVSLLSMLEQPALGYANAHAILQEVTPQGFIPNFGSAAGTSVDRSQPPVGAYCVLKLVGSQRWQGDMLTAAQREFLEDSFPVLLGWHDWWVPNRDGNQDGLLEWGSDPRAEDWPDQSIGTLRGAMYESGLDNSPMYDDVVYNPQSHTMELADVGLNALYALDAWALSELAGFLNRDQDRARLAEQYRLLGQRINSLLWDETSGIYRNRHWDGRLSSHLSPTNFYPLLAGIVPPERAQRMVREHLLNEAEFWGPLALPSISRGDPGYRQSEILRDGLQNATAAYWRGRIWGPMNFLVCEGLRRAGFDAESHALARKSLDVFLPEWQAESHVHENYNDLSGEGDDVPSADPVYHWGALLAYLGIQELVDYEPWSGWRFGCLSEESAEVDHIRIGESRLRIQTGSEGLTVWRDQQAVITTSRPSIVREFCLRTDGLACRVNLFPGTSISVCFGGLPANRPIEVNVNGQILRDRTTSASEYRLNIQTPSLVQLQWK